MPKPISALSKSYQSTLADLQNGRPLQVGKVMLTLPALAENGNSVRVTVDVEHPMDPQDYVQSITLLSQANPLPEVLYCRFSPLAGRAGFETRIRIAGEQDIVAIAQLSNGELWSQAAHIVVTEAACLEALI